MGAQFVNMTYKHPRLSDAGIRLVNHIIARPDEAGVSNDPLRRVGVFDRQQAKDLWGKKP